MHLPDLFRTNPDLHWQPTKHCIVQIFGISSQVSGQAVPHSVYSSFSRQTGLEDSEVGQSCLAMHFAPCRTKPGLHSHPITHWVVQIFGISPQVSGQAVPHSVKVSFLRHLPSEIFLSVSVIR